MPFPFRSFVGSPPQFIDPRDGGDIRGTLAQHVMADLESGALIERAEILQTILDALMARLSPDEQLELGQRCGYVPKDD